MQEHLRDSGEFSTDEETAILMDRLEARLAAVDDRWVPTGADAIALPDGAPDRPAREG